MDIEALRALEKKWRRIAEERGVVQFTGNDHLIFANELGAILSARQEVAPVDPERVAQLMAHRACHSAEHDPLNGRIHGYCMVCGIPWPCEYAGTPPTSPAQTSEARDAKRYQFLAGRAHQDKSYDIFGNSGHWSVGVHSNDNRLDFEQAVDAAMRQEADTQQAEDDDSDTEPCDFCLSRSCGGTCGGDGHD